MATVKTVAFFLGLGLRLEPRRGNGHRENGGLFLGGPPGHRASSCATQMSLSCDPMVQ